jgi:hypothetical protein
VWVNQWLHACVYCLGVFYLCRKLGASRWAAMAAVLMEGALFLFGNLGNFLPNIRTGSFAPWLFLCIIGLMVDRRFRFLAGFALLNLLMYLGGQVELIGLGYEIVAVVLIGAGIYYRRHWKRVLAAYALFAFSFIIGFILSQVQALPTMELTQFSIRSAGLTYNYFKIWSSIPMANMTMWSPYFGCGVVAVSLAAAAAGARRSAIIALLILGLAFCVFLIHNVMEFLWIIYHIPLLKGLLAHSRIYFHAKIIIAVLIALGLDRLLDSSRNREWLFTVGILSLVPAGVLFMFSADLAKVMAGSVEVTVKSNVFDLVNALKWGMAAQAVIGLAFILISLYEKKFSDFVRKTAILGMVISVYSLPIFAALPRNSLDRFKFPKEYVEFFEKNKDLGRVQTIYSWARWEDISIPLQSGILYHTRSADGFITVSVDRYTRFLNTIAPGTFREEHGKIADLEATKIFKEGAFITDKNIPFLNMMGIKNLVTERRNIKFATHYYLAYPDTTFVERRCEWVPGQRCDFRFSNPVSRISGPIHVQKGDQLIFKTDNFEKSENWWVILTGSKEGPVEKIKFSRFIKSGLYIAPTIDLGSDAGNAELTFLVGTFKPLTIPGNWNQPPFDHSYDPVVINHEKYFKRIPIETEFNIFENTGAMPPAFLLSRAESMEKEKILEKLLEPGFVPTRQAVVEGAPVGILRDLPPRQGEGVEIDRYEPEKVEMTVSAAAARLLLLTDVYFPGWRVFVDGREDRIWPADYAFRGVIIEPGVHKLRMTYEPASFRLGLWTTLASFLSLALITSIRFFKKE